MRDISDILLFRGDISPFLAHLTRTHDGIDAATRLHSILSQRQLLPGPRPVSDARFGGDTRGVLPDELCRFFGAVCFTETPVSEVHCLLEISGRAVDLEPYGLLFEKDRLKKRGVAPVVYLNNESGDVGKVVSALFCLKESVPEVAERLLPLISVFGQMLCKAGQIDFTWEREWRYPASLGPLPFSFDDVFCGLCPHEHIDEFERRYWPLKFIDPLRNMKWYARSLIESRQRLKLKYSVV